TIPRLTVPCTTIQVATSSLPASVIRKATSMPVAPRTTHGSSEVWTAHTSNVGTSPSSTNMATHAAEMSTAHTAEVRTTHAAHTTWPRHGLVDYGGSEH